MSGAVEKALAALTDGFYRPTEFPALAHQMRAWRAARPLAGRRVLDGTPIFRNTILKYRALLAAGAELTVSGTPLMPRDPAICAALREAGVRVLLDAVPENEIFDVVLDCGAAHRAVPSRYGYAELTRTGVHRYRERAQEAAVFAADSGRIKAIETCLGTGDGFLRALRQLGYGGVAGKKAVVFGFGKVGRGIVFYLTRAGARVCAADFPAVLQTLPAGVTALDIADRAALERVLSEADIVVTATGHRDALAELTDTRKLAESRALLANMGVEDEYGPAVPESRVLNGKKPLNFILAEPTRPGYIETTMALHNAGALELLNHDGGAGMLIPDSALEEALLRISCEEGEAGDEIAALLRELKKQPAHTDAGTAPCGRRNDGKGS